MCGRAGTREKQVEMFWEQADFGYVAERQKELTVLCKPQNAVRYLADLYEKYQFLLFTL